MACAPDWITTGVTSRLFLANVPSSVARYNDALEMVGLVPTVSFVAWAGVVADVAPLDVVLAAFGLELQPTAARHSTTAPARTTRLAIMARLPRESGGATSKHGGSSICRGKAAAPRARGLRHKLLKDF